MKRDDKGINRKAFPKFLLWVLLGGVLGFFAGLAGGIASDLHLADSVEAWLTGVLQAAAPLGIPVTSGVLLAICLGFYLSAKRFYMAWDGEDETLPDQVDRKLNYTLLCSSLATILDFFFIAVGVLYTGQRADGSADRRRNAGLRGAGRSGAAENCRPGSPDEPGKAGQCIRQQIPEKVV